MRKRKEEEDRVAQQNEFLNRSLRGSKKLRELEHEPPETGIVNDGFLSEHEDYNTATEEPNEPYEPIYRVVGKSADFKRIYTFKKWKGIHIKTHSNYSHSFLPVAYPDGFSPP